MHERQISFARSVRVEPGRTMLSKRALQSGPTTSKNTEQARGTKPSDPESDS